MSDEGHSLILAFDSPSSKFALGFEAGRVWALLREYPASEITEVVHAKSAEMFLRMAEATGRSVQSRELDGGTHIEVTFGAAT